MSEGNGMVRLIVSMVLCWCFWGSPACAGPLADRIAAFPNWDQKPTVQPAQGDLAYPQWFQGTWSLTSTLVDLVAPLAPTVVTPGFDSNRQYLDQPVTTTVRFVPATMLGSSIAPRPFTVPFPSPKQPAVVSDRAFNGLNLARAYLGDRAVLSVAVDPTSPNRQVTTLTGGRQLRSSVAGRITETPDNDHFLTTELFQQVFRGTPQPYLNQVETTTDYQHQPGKNPAIVADQITAIYLAPSDPQYFEAGDRPVALYRYRLEFVPLLEPGNG